jgi:hypothetical protein
MVNLLSAIIALLSIGYMRYYFGSLLMPMNLSLGCKKNFQCFPVAPIHNFILFVSYRLHISSPNKLSNPERHSKRMQRNIL